MLSPIPFFTSNPTLIPLIFLIPPYSDHIPISYLFSDPLIFLSSYLLIPFVLFLFIPALLFCLTLHAIDNHVVPFPHALISCVDSNLMLLYRSPHCSPISSSALAPCFLNLLHLNTVLPLIQPNLIIVLSAFLHSIVFAYIWLILHPFRLLSNLTSDLLSDLCLTLVSNNTPKIIGHTCISYTWVQHIIWSQVLPVTLFWSSINLFRSDSEPVQSHSGIGP